MEKAQQYTKTEAKNIFVTEYDIKLCSTPRRWEQGWGNKETEDDVNEKIKERETNLVIKRPSISNIISSDTEKAGYNAD